MGILPLTVVPIEVLAIRGAAQTASFAAAFLIGGFLNFIPSTVAQVLFAEVARGNTARRQFRKALRGYTDCCCRHSYLVPVRARHPPPFRRGLRKAATGCLRVLAVSALVAGGTYLVDSLLIARDRKLLISS